MDGGPSHQPPHQPLAASFALPCTAAPPTIQTAWADDESFRQSANSTPHSPCRLADRCRQCLISSWRDGWRSARMQTWNMGENVIRGSMIWCHFVLSPSFFTLYSTYASSSNGARWEPAGWAWHRQKKKKEEEGISNDANSHDILGNPQS
jgi:hypothetical protein